MSILCKMFGHRPRGPGWWGDIPYMKVRGGVMDGIGRAHGQAYHECRRCGVEYLAGRLHLEQDIMRRAVADHDRWVANHRRGNDDGNHER